MVNEKVYDNNVVKKPWGFEYVLFRNKKLCITYLNIDPKGSTSLHSHILKKTGFLVIEGSAHIQLGLYKTQIEKFMAPAKVMIRPGLFHQIVNRSNKNKLIALEFESPTGKQDLVRFEDKYGRQKDKYEGKNNFKKIKKPFILKNLDKIKDQKFFTNKVKILFKNQKKINLDKSNQVIYVLIDGMITNHFGKSVLPLGDLVKTGTLKKLLSKFKIKKNLKYIKVSKK